VTAWRRAATSSIATYVALCGLFALATQVLLERFDESGFTITARHDVLFISMAIAVAVIFAFASRYRAASGLLDLKRRLRLDLNELPFKGQGCRFFVSTLALSVAFAALAHHGEGRSLLGHDDVAAWLISSLVIVLLAALMSYFALRILPAVGMAILTFFITERPAPHFSLGLSICRILAQRHDTWPPPLFERPPPIQA